jgi:pimeloyl-ACP methyl ester carboxylesterase
MHQPLARALASEGFHVVTVDLLGHGRSDRPVDPKEYSMTAFGEQVVALLDHLGAPQAVIGGTSLGANVSLEVADLAPDRVRGLLLEMPVLDNALEAGLVAFGPPMFLARFCPISITALSKVTRMVPRGIVPFWLGVALDTLNQQPAPMAAVVHGLFFGRIAPPSRRRWPPRCTGSSSAGSPRRAVVAGRSRRRRWSSGTRATRSTRGRTPRCWPRRCRTRGSSPPAASSSGGCGPSGSTPRRSTS